MWRGKVDVDCLQSTTRIHGVRSARRLPNGFNHRAPSKGLRGSPCRPGLENQPGRLKASLLKGSLGRLPGLLAWGPGKRIEVLKTRT